MVDLGRIPGPIVIPNGIEVDLVWNLPWGKQVKNVLHGQVSAGFQATATVAQAVYANLIASGSPFTSWMAFVPTTASLAGINLRDLRAVGGPLVSSTGAASAGTGSVVSPASALPPGASIVVTERTSSAGRNFRGRVYLPAMHNSLAVLGTGLVTAAASTAALNFLTQVQTSLATQSITLAIINPARQAYTGKRLRAIPARPATLYQVSSFNVRGGGFNSQRRRSVAA